MYSYFDICPELDAGTKCFKLRKYASGSFEVHHHQHVPARRIGIHASLEVLRCLVARHAKLSSEHIVAAFLNDRGKQPARENPWQIHIEYPEPGVIRYHCGTNVHAWLDAVIDRSVFRVENAG